MNKKDKFQFRFLSFVLLIVCVVFFPLTTLAGKPSTCTEADWLYSDEECQPDNTFIRTWTKITNCKRNGGVSHPSSEVLACTYEPPACTEADWSYSDGPCQLDNTLTRTWTKNSNCEGGVSHPANETLSCNAPAIETIRIAAADDTYIRGGIDNENISFGYESSFEVKKSSIADYNRLGLLQFDLRQFSGTVVQATLSLRPSAIQDQNNIGATEQHLYLVKKDLWDETSVTWSNCPNIEPEPFATFEILSTDTDVVKEVDLTNAVQNELNGDGIISLGIKSAMDSFGVSYYSKENTTVPREWYPYLTIETETSEPESTADYYVGTFGDNSNPGTIEEPFRTLEKGVSVLLPGQTLKVLAGTYLERLRVDVSGTEENPITIEAESGVILDGPNNYPYNPDDPKQNIYIGGSHIVVKGFEGRNSDSIYGVHVHHDASNVVLQGLNIHEADYHGISVEGTNVTVEDCLVWANNQRNFESAVDQWGSGIKIRLANNVTVRNNRVIENWGEGIGVRADNVDVLNNLVEDNFGCNIYVDNAVNVDVVGNFSFCTDDTRVIRDGKKATGISTGEEYYEDYGNRLSNINVVNNIVYNCYDGFAHGGTYVGEGGLRESRIMNNTFYNIKNHGIRINEGEETDVLVANNIFHTIPDSETISHFRDDLNDDGVAQGITLMNNLWATERRSWDVARLQGVNDLEGIDPGFEIVPTYKVSSFKLSESSPAVDMGMIEDSDGPWNFDLEGNERDAEPDVGALEQGATSNWFDDYFGL